MTAIGCESNLITSTYIFDEVDTLRTVLIAIFAVFTIISSSSAATISYLDASAFASATSGVTTIDFEGFPGGPVAWLSVYEDAGSGVTFDNAPGSDAAIFLFAPDFYYPGTSVLSIQGSTSGVNSLRITFPTPVIAFATLIGAFAPGNLDFQLSTGDTGPVALGLPYPTLAFFGLTSDTPFSSITLTGPSDGVYNLDNVQFGAAAEAPEPASLLLLSTGVVGLAARRFRQKRSS